MCECSRMLAENVGNRFNYWLNNLSDLDALLMTCSCYFFSRTLVPPDCDISDTLITTIKNTVLYECTVRFKF